jgi:hypothetical protein
MHLPCHYCANQSTKTLVWLKDKNRQPARIRLPWCGCDLMAALKRFWPSPYPVQEGVDYEVENPKPKISDNIAEMIKKKQADLDQHPVGVQKILQEHIDTLQEIRAALLKDNN